MGNYAYLIKELDINKKFLQSKKDQTLYKIKYIVEYVKTGYLFFVKEKVLKILILLILCV
ncbi:prophage minor tail protein, partial [Fusobacterium animalis ATCC 51191]